MFLYLYQMLDIYIIHDHFPYFTFKLHLLSFNAHLKLIIKNTNNFNRKKSFIFYLFSKNCIQF